MKNNFKFCLLLVFAFVSGCGGGGSSSGGMPEDIRATLGTYSGEFTLSFMFDGQMTPPQSSPLEITVVGQGQFQQAIIAFREFSGSSSVGQNLDFFIPSGSFNLNAGGGLLCPGTLNFSGTFTVTPPAASGTVTGNFRCPGIPIAIDAEGTFNVTLSQT